MPIAAYAMERGGNLWLRALVGSPTVEHLRAEDLGTSEEAEALGNSCGGESNSPRGQRAPRPSGFVNEDLVKSTSLSVS